SDERQVVARNLIDFDKEWSTLMAKKPEEFDNPEALADFYTRTFEFPSGLMTQYQPTMITGTARHQALAGGFPIGKRFKSATTVRVADANPIHLGHHARADGRWRLYAFADADHSALNAWAAWLTESAQSPILRHTAADADLDSVFDVKVIYQAPYTEVDIGDTPRLF